MKEFFDGVRKSFGSLTENQVEGLTALLSAVKDLPRRHQAYILATAWHETGPEDSPLHMRPRREIWGPTKAQIRYEGRADLGNTIMGDGKRYAGRGYVQITGRANYKKASALVGKDLVSAPDLALDKEIAAKIIVHGMTNGWFTGKKLADFDSYENMRRVVNGTDEAKLIAGYAEKFEDALKMIRDEPVVLPPKPVELPPEVAARGTNVAAWIIGAILTVFAIAGTWFMGGK